MALYLHQFSTELKCRKCAFGNIFYINKKEYTEQAVKILTIDVEKKNFNYQMLNILEK